MANNVEKPSFIFFSQKYMRNIPINDVDHLPSSGSSVRSDYPADTLLDTHSHRRAQFLYAPEGLMKVETEDGQWLVTLQRCMDTSRQTTSGMVI